jgi:tetratricopeptide (TPR) repeat protein
MAGLAAIGLPAAAENAKRPTTPACDVVYLERSPGWELQGNRGLLVRELVRQSLLIAARDELGLLTRDSWLGEAMPAAGAGRPIDLVVHPGDPEQIDLCRGTGSTRQTLGQWEFHHVSRERYGDLGREMEQLSRTKFVELLKKAGWQGKPNPWKSDLALPGEAQRLLQEMTFSSQFLALRQIHQAIRSQGESPALLAGLVRGYANLGVLTEFHWHPAHKVFKARALLYAWRLTQHGAQPLWAAYHRAYAYALLGLHARAIRELDGADRQFHAAPPGNVAERPSWAELLSSYCRYRMDQIHDESVDPADRQLFLLLEYHDAEASGSANLAVETALRVLEKMPECYRVHDGLCRFAGVAAGHMATLQGLLLVGQKLYPRLENVADLPAGVRRVIQSRAVDGALLPLLFGPRRPDPRQEFQARARLIAALLAAGRVEAPAAGGGTGKMPAPPRSKPDQAGQSPVAAPADAADVDRAEFSWSILGHMLRELSFVQVWRRVHFEGRMLGVETEQFLADSAPLVQSHPYRIALAAMTMNVEARQKALEESSRLEPESIEMTSHAMWDEMCRYNRNRRDQWLEQAYAHHDDVVRDLDLTIHVYSNARPRFARTLLRVSPHNPCAQAVLIGAAWESVQGLAADWEKDDQPAVLKALGEHYAAEGRPADAERCLQSAIKRSPDKTTYEALAALYEKQGNEEKWLSTLEGFLQQPDYGLYHAAVQQKIAIHFAERGQWEKALPSAEAAAETYSAWGLNLAACCHEVFQNWSEAEKYFKAESERYDSQQLKWYFFCKRTGHGDLSAATQLARHFAEQPHEKDSYRETLSTIAYFYLLEHQREKALAGFQESFAAKPNPLMGLHVALIADELKDPKIRDLALERVNTQGPRYQSTRTKKVRRELIGLANLIAKDLAAGGKGLIDPAEVEKLSAQADAPERLCIDVFLGKYLDLHGRREDAVRAWKRGVACTTAAHSITVDDKMRTLAAANLLRLGIKPEDYQDLVHKSAKK